MNVIDHVRGMSKFQFYRDGQLWYKTDDTKLEFPVPIDDIGTATFHSIEKSLLMMRYIRKWLKIQEQARLAQR